VTTEDAAERRTTARVLLGLTLVFGAVLAILESLVAENQKLRAAASPGFARTRRIAFGRSGADK
jgi:hypothetical protein